MDYSNLAVANIMENSIRLEKVNLLFSVEGVHARHLHNFVGEKV